MRNKINKFLALLICVTLMVSLAVPVMAMADADDGCCDNHLDDGHVHGGSAPAPTPAPTPEPTPAPTPEPTPEPKSDPDDNKESGSSEHGGGVKRRHPCN